MTSDRSNEPSAFGWVMTGTLGALAVGGIVWRLVKGRQSAVMAADDGRGYSVDDDTTDAEGHPS